MKVLTSTVGRILFALPFLIFGLFHFMSAEQMAGMVPVPGGVFWVYFTGVALIAAAVSMLINKYAKLASLLLAALLLVFVLAIHLPAVLGGDQMAMISLLKDISMAGGALLMADRYDKLM